jgi:hypothetical protein
MVEAWHAQGDMGSGQIVSTVDDLYRWQQSWKRESCDSNNFRRNATMQESRIDKLEQKLGPAGDGVVTITIGVCFCQTYFDSEGQRREREVPAIYDEAKAVEWPPHYNPGLKRWEKFRWLYPVNLDDAGEPLNEGLAPLGEAGNEEVIGTKP